MTGDKPNDSALPRSNAEWIALDREYVLQARYTSPYVLERGAGSKLWDVEGREFLDFHSGQVCANTGHCHPDLAAATARQLERLVQTGSMFTNPPQILLAKKLAEITPEPLQKSFFACSGSEAIEMALRAAKFFTGRSEVMGVLRSYHGMTMGAFSLSSVAGFGKQGYGYAVANINYMPPPYCYRCDFNETYPGCRLECLSYGKKIAELIGAPAAIVLELVVSGGGVYVPPVEWVQQLYAYCRERGILFIVDECQTGIGRTGTWFAFEHFGVVPDIVVTSKGLGGGIPLSGILVTRDVARGLEEKGHVQTSSHSGDPLLCAGGLANIELIERHDMLANVRAMGARLKDGLQQLVRRHEIVGDARGLGLLQGIEIVTDKQSRTAFGKAAGAIVQRCTDAGLFVGAPATKQNIIRLLPPFVVTAREVDTALDILDRAIFATAQELAPAPSRVAAE
jgi:4-aminobutyrate aminotransferase-like enzyme